MTILLRYKWEFYLSINFGGYRTLTIPQGCNSGLSVGGKSSTMGSSIRNVNVILDVSWITQGVGLISKSVTKSTPVDGYHSNSGPVYNANGILTFALSIFQSLS